MSLLSQLRLSAGIAVACWLLVVVGCSPNDGRIEVQGTVLLDGEPLDGASVAFVANGGGTFATASTDDEGKFVLRAPPGVNKVSISKMDTSHADEFAQIPEEDLLAGTPAEMAEAMKNAPKPLVAQKYFNADTSGVEFTVEPGMAAVVIEVTAN